MRTEAAPIRLEMTGKSLARIGDEGAQCPGNWEAD
jgi:hypothetical protein